ncbi:MAG: hypothetical protein UY04_C0002G0009 [Parcubacteria group bacterium GW2011_GWA2_47_7]|nr:MAG: hypothetical protein UY04_C0002G0009 [Parcubacteria group bacterium GW2011_GWA2_47_7]
MEQKFLVEREFHARLLRAVREFNSGDVLSIERKNGVVTVRRATESQLVVWSSGGGGGSFRRYPKYQGDWSPQDKRKMLPISRAPSFVLFVRIEDEDIVVFPPRHLCVS